MEVVVTSAEMQACDRFAIKKLRIPGILLMENAGRETVAMMEQHFGVLAGKSILVMCGKGNNGGDGFVVARHLYTRGAQVVVILVGKSSQLKNDAKTNCEIIKSIVKKLPKNTVLEFRELKSARTLSALPEADIVVDALFGTGFSGKVRGIHLDVIRWMNKVEAKKASIDVPSGLDADRGTVGNVAVKADLTVTMGLRKTGLLLNEGRSQCGNIEVADLGVPSGIVNPVQPASFVVHESDVRKILPRRPLNAHKHSVGKVLVLAGSCGFTGAAAMAAQSAMRAGAGAVVLGTPASVYPILAKKLTEVMVEPLPETSEGTLSLQAFESVEKRIAWADVVILGPGVSTNPDTRDLVWKIVMGCTKPLLIDADALNILSQKKSILKLHRSKNVIITPHTGELSRLIRLPAAEIERNRVDVARQVAKEFKVTVVLKGAPTVTASEDGYVYINSTGNPGMATAGSGDVLAGLIGGLWAQRMDGAAAAYAGMFVHGHAGDCARDKYGEKSLLATDIQDFLPSTLHHLESRVLS